MPWVGVFIFDQSTNHNAYPRDALLTSRMTLNPKLAAKTEWPFRSGWFIHDNNRVEQDLFFITQPTDGSEPVRMFKGIKMVKFH